MRDVRDIFLSKIEDNKEHTILEVTFMFVFTAPYVRQL